jgi:hypothetical protein
MAPHYDDPQHIEGFEEAVRDTAYFLWEQAGRPDGRSDEFWYQALTIHVRERAYGIWRRQLEEDGTFAQGEETGAEGEGSLQPGETEPIGDISQTDLSEDETLRVAEGIEHERDA